MALFIGLVILFYMLYSKSYRVKEDNNYKPRFGGTWVNKGNEFEEDWIWVEEPVHNLHTYWISVMKNESEYDIYVDTFPKKDAVEHLDCESPTELRVGINMMFAYYNTLGSTRIHNPFEIGGREVE